MGSKKYLLHPSERSSHRSAYPSIQPSVSRNSTVTNSHHHLLLANLHLARHPLLHQHSTHLSSTSLSVTRNTNPTTNVDDASKQDDIVSDTGHHIEAEQESVMAEQGSVRNESVDGGDDDYDDDDWEGVESTELDEAFSAATAFVAAAAADRLSQKVSNDIQLQVYGLYKIATEGPCSTPQPSPLKMTARSKWQAWQKLGAMPPEDAMQKYIDIVSELYPTWLDGAPLRSRTGDSGGPSSDARGPMGPVFSSFVYEEECSGDSKMDAIHGFAREGDLMVKNKKAKKTK